MNLKAALRGKCPRCNEGDMFKNKSVFPLKEAVDMVKECPVCGQKTELEVGFYYGTGYLSYGLSVGFVVLSFILGVVFFDVNFLDNSTFYLLGIDVALLFLLQPWMMRFSRLLYLSFFVKNNKKNGAERETDYRD